jgi:hypothetical protein
MAVPQASFASRRANPVILRGIKSPYITSGIIGEGLMD